ncbi:hypothetical protein TanjilG_21072 [Lupinus angustifolius]|uniref:GAG-pre-integrase domain-containing protein n=1 Tax=Lupinus angustifolius TaxID=3871 RepID=A0A1J7H683_LUPAN|nr:hypothetical protein TanjilG_21072 [Lupinus angustifolius]
MTIYDDQKRKILNALLTNNRTFQVKLEARNSQCLNAITKKDETWLWHLRYSHLNFRDLGLLRSKGMVSGLPEIKPKQPVCESCITGKLSRTPFCNHTQARALDMLHVIYSDVCGPMKVSTLRGNKYFLSFIDEFSRKMWIYMIRAKSKVFSNMIRYKAMVER